MDYSIVIPVFNKSALTRQCLATLRPTLEGAGEGEVIVIDNASSDRTPEMLAEFPWVIVVRNEINLGFAGANNQGARLARGKYLVMLNNDIVAHPGWLAAMLADAREDNVGAVGARLLFPDNTIQHAGVVISLNRVGSATFTPVHDAYRAPAEDPGVMVRHDVVCVTGACLVTPRELYLELGGLDEGFWNGYEDVDYCLRIRSRGFRIVYEPRAALTHFESQSGVQRFRRVAYNVKRLMDRWSGKVVADRILASMSRGKIVRENRNRGMRAFSAQSIPRTTVIVHGDPNRSAKIAQAAALRANLAPIADVIRVESARAVEVARAEMERRGDRYLAFVDARAQLEDGWLDELVRQIEFGASVCAATYAPELPVGEDVNPLAADARCTLLSLRMFPADLRLGGFATMDAAVADFLLRALGMRLATRGAGRAVAALPTLTHDPDFESVQGIQLPDVLTTDARTIEQRLTVARRPRGLTSIVMLSWNAPQYTKLALESIRQYTPAPYEIVIVDNGSDAITTAWLAEQGDVRVLYNPSNRGFAGGCNQGMAAALGERIVLLNNDVIVTEGWLDGLLDAFDRIPRLGVSAVRSNRIAGDQVVSPAPYNSIPAMHEFAAARRRRFQNEGYYTDRAIGLCLCIDRKVVEEIGGIDERYGVGNFEDDDFCLRVRAAGYNIFVCDDVFIHHFGSQTFAANKIDYNKTLSENWEKFARKWELGPLRGGGYDSTVAIARGFDRKQYYVALPVDAYAGTIDPAVVESKPEVPQRAYRLAFVAVVEDEHDWTEVGAFARRFAKAFSASDDVLLTIAATGTPSAQILAARIQRSLTRDGIDDATAADIEIVDDNYVPAWLDAIPAQRRLAVVARPATQGLELLARQSPSALRRYLDQMEGV